MNGFKKNSSNQSIRKDISDEVKKLRCSVLCIGSQIEVDHKDGRKDDSKIISIENQSKNDFQPLSKSVNIAKKTHCIDCKKTGLRFDAKKLGYSVSQTIGEAKYENSCVGFYWYDPIAFNREISSSYIKTHQGNDIIIEIENIPDSKTYPFKVRISLSALLDIGMISQDIYELIKNSEVRKLINIKNEREQKFTLKRVQ